MNMTNEVFVCPRVMTLLCFCIAGRWVLFSPTIAFAVTIPRQSFCHSQLVVGGLKGGTQVNIF